MGNYLQVEGEATTTATVTETSSPNADFTYYTLPDTRYRCGTCGKLYEYDSRHQTSCCVLHAPGDCCHLGETLISEPLPGGELTANDN
jgi:hypothetical protein